MADAVLTANNWFHDGNRDLLAENRLRIRKQISKCIANNGFKRKGRSTFVRFSGDLVAYSCIEHPSIMFYVWFCVYPLFMPPMEYLTLNIGHRLSELINDHTMNMNIRDYATQTETDLWCDRTSQYIQESFIPLIDQFDTAEKMTQYFSSALHQPCFDTFKALKARQDEIEMYAWLRQHEYGKSAASAERFRAKTESARFTDAVKAREEARFRQIVNLACTRDDRAVDDLFGQWREQNVAFFTEKKRAKALPQ